MELISTTDTFTVSLENQRSVLLTFPWFVSQAKYPPRPANRIMPLINGEKAFEAVHKAIVGAQHSVEIINWGFDPSMNLLRIGKKEDWGDPLGTLLKAKARGDEKSPPVDIRILIWKNALANFVENNIHGDGLIGSGGSAMGAGKGSTAAYSEGGTDKQGYNEYGSNVFNSAGVRNHDPEAAKYNRDWFKDLPEHLTFRTRDYSLLDRAKIVLEQLRNGSAGVSQTAAMSLFASHHQKTILVDYEHPEIATGFVMGHNLLRNYWDTDKHEFHSDARQGFAPWQDLSCQVWGPVLHDLNENFMEAWQKSDGWFTSSRSWREKRAAIPSEAFIKPALAKGDTYPAQICRTQSQEDERSILDAYRLGIGNARFYMYFENQYFRYEAFAELMRQVRRKLKGRGWPSDFYVFVVTSPPDSKGRTNTYEMLAALGQGERMPEYHRDTEKKPDPDAELRKIDLDGVNIHICTLQVDGEVIVDGKKERKYNDIYVHSKLLLVDDVFFTLGSANVNARSMEGDSELNISCPSPDLTKQWRERLWEIHTKNSPEIELRDEFRRWGDEMASNEIFTKKGDELSCSLLGFHDPNDRSWGAPD
ncbi:phospholipase D-like domain-containing protein [Pseudomonas aeruginosa]